MILIRSINIILFEQSDQVTSVSRGSSECERLKSVKAMTAVERHLYAKYVIENHYEKMSLEFEWIR